jgi:phosphoglycerate dehydrogenase-like enzyme
LPQSIHSEHKVKNSEVLFGISRNFSILCRNILYRAKKREVFSLPHSGLNILVLNYNLKEHHLETITDAAKGSRVTFCEIDDAKDFIHDCDILVYWSLKPIDKIIANAPRLKWIHALGVGVETIDFNELSSDIVVTNSKGVGSIPVAEHTLALMLAFTRGLNVYMRQQKEHLWKYSPVDEIYEKTLGIIGLGTIGRAIAKKAKSLGMKVLAVNRRLSSELFVDEMFPADPNIVLEVFSESDFIVVCLPLTKETEKLINSVHFKAMKPSAYFFNISRGAVVNEEHLIDALQNNLIKGAGLDVFADEPLPENSPFWDMPNVIITPHIGAASPLYADRAVKLFADNLTRYLEGSPMINVVDKSSGY